MKMVAKNQKVRSTRCAADDALQQVIKAFHQPFQEVLRATRHFGHAARRHLGEDNQRQGDDPRHDHRVRDREPEGPGDLDGLLRQAVCCFIGEGETDKIEHVAIGRARLVPWPR